MTTRRKYAKSYLNLVEKMVDRNIDGLDPDKDNVIDHERFDYEWMRQASLYDRYSYGAAVAGEIYNELKFQLDKLKASKTKRIKLNPGKYGLDPDKIPAQNSIPPILERMKEVKDLQSKIIKAEATKNFFAGYLRALEHKKRSMEKIQERIINGMFVEPKIAKKKSKERGRTTTRKVKRTNR
jgi:hypothetical protein